VAAQRFLDKHELPSSYADQVVDFIHKNTAGVSIGGGGVSEGGGGDPFTGGSRYTGGSAGGGNTGYSDPFTGQFDLWYRWRN
jgi:phospholipase A-2-activating protein